MKSIESIDKTAKSIIAFDSINYGVYSLPSPLLRSKTPEIQLEGLGERCKLPQTL